MFTNGSMGVYIPQRVSPGHRVRITNESRRQLSIRYLPFPQLINRLFRSTSGDKISPLGCHFQLSHTVMLSQQKTLPVRSAVESESRFQLAWLSPLELL